MTAKKSETGNHIISERYKRLKTNIAPRLSLTIPGKGLSVRQALARWTAGTLQEQVAGYYYDAYNFPDEETPPDFNTMDTVELLSLLAVKRQQVTDLQAKLKEGAIIQPKQ